MKKTLSYGAVALFFFVLGLGLAVRFDWFADAQARRLWIEYNGSKDPSAPLTRHTFVKLAKQLSPAVVNITVVRSSHSMHHQWFERYYGPDPQPRRGLGTGFIINKNGTILTNNHVVKDATQITVRLANDSTYTAQVLGRDPRTDIAVIKITPREPLTVAPLGHSRPLQIGEWVMAIGNPFGLSHTVTVGIVSAKGRRSVRPSREHMYANFIQTDASINPGNSGGPLINTYGEVIGINTAISRSGHGIGFAIPIDMVKTLLPQLIKGHVRRSWLGVMIGPVSKQLSVALNMSKPRGALVSEVVPDGPAARAGLQPGDVIMSFNGTPIQKSAELPWLASTVGIGKRVTLLVNRNGRRMTRGVVMGEFPDQRLQTRRGPQFTPPSSSSVVRGVGIRVGDPTPRLRARFRTGSTRGALILDVDDGSVGQLAGLRRGDLITRANGTRINSASDLLRVISPLPSGGLMRINIQRQKRQIFVVLTKG